MKINSIQANILNSTKFTKTEQTNNTQKSNYHTQVSANSLEALEVYNKNLVTFKGINELNKKTAFGLDLDSYRPTTSQYEYPHSTFLRRSKVLTPITMMGFTPLDDFWHSPNPNTKDEEKSAWKMHIYADSEADWQKLVDTVGKYLNDTNVKWKTLGLGTVEKLNINEQKGKAFTVYPASNDEFAQLAHDIDYIIKNNNLTTSQTEIAGDRQLGDSGRIFYRYEYRSGKDKDLILDMNKTEDSKRYKVIYEPNRGTGKLSHLAQDMKISDDPWYYFSPKAFESKSNSLALVSHKLDTYSINNTLRKGVIYKLDESIKQLEFAAGATSLRIDNPEFQRILSNMPNDSTIVLGRNQSEVDIHLGNINTISGKHMIIYKEDDKYYMQDISTNGTVARMNG